MRIISQFEDESLGLTWAYVENERRGTWCSDYSNDLLDSFDATQSLVRRGLDPAKLPHIEDAPPVLQDLWHRAVECNDLMLFIEADEDYIWAGKFGVSKEKYVEQVSEAVKEFGLEDVIEIPDNTHEVLVCYGNFQSSFSEEFNEEDW